MAGFIKPYVSFIKNAAYFSFVKAVNNPDVSKTGAGYIHLPSKCAQALNQQRFAPALAEEIAAATPEVPRHRRLRQKFHRNDSL